MRAEKRTESEKGINESGHLVALAFDLKIYIRKGISLSR